MKFFELAAWLVGNFFVAGIIVGLLIVEVLPGDGRGNVGGGNWPEPSSRDDDWPPRWPGR